MYCIKAANFCALVLFLESFEDGLYVSPQQDIKAHKRIKTDSKVRPGLSGTHFHKKDIFPCTKMKDESCRIIFELYIRIFKICKSILEEKIWLDVHFSQRRLDLDKVSPKTWSNSFVHTILKDNAQYKMYTMIWMKIASQWNHSWYLDETLANWHILNWKRNKTRICQELNQGLLIFWMRSLPLSHPGSQ